MPVNSKIIDNNRNYFKLLRNLHTIDKAKVKIGYPANKNKYDDGVDVAEIAISNNFGTDKIPARPFFTQAFDENKAALNSLIFKLYKKITSFNSEVSKSLDILGLFMVGKIQAKIVSLRTPPNSPLTIELKKSSNPLIDTGHMRQSTTYEKEIKG